MATRNGSVERELRKRGRQPGQPTQKNKLLREMIEEFTDNNFDVFAKKMKLVKKPEMYAKLYLELMSFRMPKLKSVDFKGDVKNMSLELKLKALHENSISSNSDEAVDDPEEE